VRTFARVNFGNETVRVFAGVNFNNKSEQTPDETRLRDFRRLLEKRNPGGNTEKLIVNKLM
jgi:hypothetical protein